MEYFKKPLTYDEQLERLKESGIIIKDKNKAKEILSNINYYILTGYIYQYKNSDDKYTNGLTFDKMYRIYLFDKKFRNLLWCVIEIIEISLKTKIAYESAHKLGAFGYLEKSNFKNQEEFDILVKKLKKQLKMNNNLEFVKHHYEKYDGKFPIWVGINVFTMGMLYNYYKNIAENIIEKSIKKTVASEYNTGSMQLCSWIENILYIRNMLAHHMRIYNVRFQKVPAKCKKNHKENYSKTKRIFDTVHIMKFMILDKDIWNNNIIMNMSALFEEYSDIIDISLLGFPKEWEKILRK